MGRRTLLRTAAILAFNAAQVCTAADFTWPVSTTNSLYPTNNAVLEINPVYDTGTVCRVVAVGPSVVGVASVNGETGNLAVAQTMNNLAIGAIMATGGLFNAGQSNVNFNGVSVDNPASRTNVLGYAGGTNQFAIGFRDSMNGGNSNLTGRLAHGARTELGSLSAEAEDGVASIEGPLTTTPLTPSADMIENILASWEVTNNAEAFGAGPGRGDFTSSVYRSYRDNTCLKYTALMISLIFPAVLLANSVLIIRWLKSREPSSASAATSSYVGNSFPGVGTVTHNLGIAGAVAVGTVALFAGTAAAMGGTSILNGLITVIAGVDLSSTGALPGNAGIGNLAGVTLRWMNCYCDVREVLATMNKCLATTAAMWATAWLYNRTLQTLIAWGV